MPSDIVLIHAGNQPKTYQALAAQYTAIAPPVWLSLIAHYLRSQGFSVAIHDANVQGWSLQTAQQLLDKHHPELMAIMVYGHNPSASTQAMPAAIQIANDIKAAERTVPLAMGGLHPNALAQETLREAPVDFVVRGEGVYPLGDLAEWSKGRRLKDRVRGVSFTDARGQVVHNQAPELIKDLDVVLPDYAWDLIPPLSAYRAHNSHTLQYFEQSTAADYADVRSPYAVLYASLGCPYQCSYCCTNSLFGKSGQRCWSLDTVLRWVDTLVNEHHVKHIRFDDELFIMNHKRIELLCDRLIERRYDLNLWAYSRVDTLPEKLLGKMKSAGFNWLCLGIEAADKAVRHHVRKTFSNDIGATVRALKRNGIHVMGNFMFGLPTDTPETMQATLDMALALQCEFVNFYCTMAYPGSELYRYWMGKDPNVMPETWNGYSQHSYDAKPLPTEYLSGAQVLEFRDQAFETYFTHPTYLDMIKNKFGPKALEHITRMTEIKLRRKLLERDCLEENDCAH
jgi:radical SAM superfamily enzyme YgiQ (UPF0313 family)